MFGSDVPSSGCCFSTFRCIEDIQSRVAAARTRTRGEHEVFGPLVKPYCPTLYRLLHNRAWLPQHRPKWTKMERGMEKEQKVIPNVKILTDSPKILSLTSSCPQGLTALVLPHLRRSHSNQMLGHHSDCLMSHCKHQARSEPITSHQEAWHVGSFLKSFSSRLADY